MTTRPHVLCRTLVYALTLFTAACQSASDMSNGSSRQNGKSTVTLAPADMKPIGTIDDRYQSYNVEMLEVTGGK